ncbi:MAG: dethiobiotin synthase [Sulfuriferula sp.]
MPRAYFIAGTDTGVGKTLVSAMLLHGFAAQGLRTVGMKPVASGATELKGEAAWDDVLQLQAESTVDMPLAVRNPYRFAPPIAPHIAARQAGQRIDMLVIRQAYSQLQNKAEVVIVEGAGGFYTPLNDTDTMADLVVLLDLPVILVVALQLGCINHALLTQQAISSHGLVLAGWVANQIQPAMLARADNLATLQQRINAPLLGVLPYQERPTAEASLIHIQMEGL